MHPLYWLTLTAALLSIIIVGIAISKRSAPKSLYFTFLAVVICLYMLGYLFEAGSSSLEAAYQAFILKYLGLPFIPYFALLFLLDYYGKKLRLWIRWLLATPALATVALVATYPLNGLFCVNVRFVAGPPLARLVVTPTPLYYLSLGYIYLLLGACLVCVFYFMHKLPQEGKGLHASNIVAVLLPLLANLAYVLGFTPYHLDFTPIVMLITLGIMGLSVCRLNLLQVLPLAKDVILDKMNDAVIIADNDLCYLDANIAAQKIFPALQQTRFGTPLAEIAGFADYPFAEPSANQELALTLEDKAKYYRMSKTDVYLEDKKQCSCFIFYDITQTKNLLEELNYLATYDNLTQIYNRGSFFQLAGYGLEQVIQQHGSAAIMQLDLDHFKRVNDSYGHLCGDMVLTELASRLQRRLRATDIFGRYGGEEFSIFLAGITEKNALNLAEDLRKIVAEEPFHYQEQSFTVTISIGVCLYRRASHSHLQQLVSDADNALYEAKAGGRNQVVLSREQQRQTVAR